MRKQYRTSNAPSFPSEVAVQERSPIREKIVKSKSDVEAAPADRKEPAQSRPQWQKNKGGQAFTVDFND